MLMRVSFDREKKDSLLLLLTSGDGTGASKEVAARIKRYVHTVLSGQGPGLVNVISLPSTDAHVHDRD